MKWTLFVAGIYTVILLTMAERQASAGIELLTKSIMRGGDYTLLKRAFHRARRLMLWQRSGGVSREVDLLGLSRNCRISPFPGLVPQGHGNQRRCRSASHFQMSPHL
jgi:hypothetical protein